MSMQKFYLLYTDDKQSKFLSMARDLEAVKNESEYFTTGTWFEYEQKEGSNFLSGEKKLNNIVFPSEAKVRTVNEFGTFKKPAFKWVT